MEPGSVSDSHLEMTKEKLWNRNYILCLVSNIFCAFVFFTLMVTVAAYSVEKFDVAQDVAGLVVSIFVLGSMLTRIVTARFLDRDGGVGMLKLGGVLLIVSGAAYFLPSGLLGFLAIRVFNGMAWGIICNALNTIVVRCIPKNRQGEGISYYTLGNIIATALGPLVGITIIDDFGPVILFAFTLGCAVCAVVLAAMLDLRHITDKAAGANGTNVAGEIDVAHSSEDAEANETPNANPKRETGNTEGTRGSLLDSVFDKRSLLIAAVTVIMTVCYSSIQSFMQLNTLENGVPWVSRVFFIVYSVVTLISRPFFGRLHDRSGDNIVIFPAVSFFAAGMFVLSRAHTPAVFLAAAFVIALGYGPVFSGLQVIGVKVAPPERAGIALSTIYIFADCGMGIGPFIWGIIARHFDYQQMYFGCVIGIACGLVLYWVLHGRAASRKYRVVKQDFRVKK